MLIDMPAGPNNDERRAFIHDGRKLTIFNAVRFLLFDLSVIQKKNTISPTIASSWPTCGARTRPSKWQLHEVGVARSPSEPRFDAHSARRDFSHA